MNAEIWCYAVFTADVSVTCISFVRNIGMLAVGFNFGCFQLWKLSIPVLEYVTINWTHFDFCFLMNDRVQFLYFASYG